MEIVIVSPGMKSGPDTLKFKSLGGSETAAISLAKSLKKRGHIVTLFCNLPDPGEPDHMESGMLGEDGVRYINMEGYGPFITTTEVDLLIVSRGAEGLHLNHQARYSVLWTHDLATITGTLPSLQGSGWNFDEIWCVSEFHRQQYAKVTGYPLDHIRVLPNGINEYDLKDKVFVRDDHVLMYAARPERGLEALVRPGGIMDCLGGAWRLEVAMYANFPPHMKDYYDWLFAMCEQNPKVTFLGPLTQRELRLRLATSGGYAYPTAFEETSCILAQEVMSVGIPFYATNEGALPETLGAYGTFYTGDSGWNSDDFCQGFADMIRENADGSRMAQQVPSYRTWDEVAGLVDNLFETRLGRAKPLFSRLWGLIETSDVIPAIALWRATPISERDSWSAVFMERVEKLYPYLYGRESFADYYERYFVREDTKGARIRRSMAGNPRFEQIAAEIEKLPAGSHVMDYGCAEGVIILDLANRFRDKQFMGVDFAASNVELCRGYAQEMGLTNVLFCVGNTESSLPSPAIPFDAVICTEVLEHVVEPWTVIGALESKVRPGGRVITTVPMGNWEAIGLYDRGQYWWRAHIWSIDKWMLREMFRDKDGARMVAVPHGSTPEGRALGHIMFCYDADHKPVGPINAVDKANRLRSQETVTACIITNSCDSLGKTLKSLNRAVQAIRIGVFGVEDSLLIEDTIDEFARKHPWIAVRAFYGPKIEAGKFGFDDARQRSIEGIQTEWALWIDSDEYLSGDISRYLRHNAFDSYSIHQHHFTVDPRGVPASMDKPARLFRMDRGFKFYGKVHEHAEKGENGGPGFCMILADVDIGHTGYVNEGTRQGRFHRNFPLLEWDHELNPNRRLGKFLWLRDIIHRMRYNEIDRNIRAARLLAEEAVSYYLEHWSDGALPGMGGENAFHYYSEALQMLGRGQKIDIVIKIADDNLVLSGVFESADDVKKMVGEHLKGPLEKLKSKYYR